MRFALQSSDDADEISVTKEETNDERLARLVCDTRLYFVTASAELAVPINTAAFSVAETSCAFVCLSVGLFSSKRPNWTGAIFCSTTTT